MAVTEHDVDLLVNASLDDYADPADSPLLEPGSDGLIGNNMDGPSMLREAYRRHEAGASLASIKRDFACSGVFDVTTKVMENVIEAGRWCEEQATQGRVKDRSRQFRGFATATCPSCSRRVLTRALRPRAGGCAVCVVQ